MAARKLENTNKWLRGIQGSKYRLRLVPEGASGADIDRMKAAKLPKDVDDFIRNSWPGLDTEGKNNLRKIMGDPRMRHAYVDAVAKAIRESEASDAVAHPRLSKMRSKYFDPYDGKVKGGGAPSSSEPIDARVAIPSVPLRRSDGRLKSTSEIKDEVNRALEIALERDIGRMIGKSQGYPRWALKAVLSSVYDGWKMKKERSIANVEAYMREEGLTMDAQGYMHSRPKLISVDEFASKNNFVPAAIDVRGIPESMGSQIRERILQTLRTQEGMRTNDEILKRDIRTLTDTGYFSNVKVWNILHGETTRGRKGPGRIVRNTRIIVCWGE